MKKQLLAVVLFCAALALISCSKGTDGANGPTGPAGDGIITMSFQQGEWPADSYDGATDARINRENPTSVEGNADWISAGVYLSSGMWRSVIKFDLSSVVPSNIIVTKAYLTLKKEGAGGTTTITAYAVTTEWNEVTDGATWNQAQSGASNVSWTAAGGDFSITPASNSVAVYGSATEDSYTFTLTPSVVQSWISNPDDNYGILLKATNETLGVTNRAHFYSSNYSTVQSRPKLTIYYKLP